MSMNPWDSRFLGRSKSWCTVSIQCLDERNFLWPIISVDVVFSCLWLFKISLNKCCYPPRSSCQPLPDMLHKIFPNQMEILELFEVFCRVSRIHHFKSCKKVLVLFQCVEVCSAKMPSEPCSPQVIFQCRWNKGNEWSWRIVTWSGPEDRRSKLNVLPPHSRNRRSYPFTSEGLVPHPRNSSFVSCGCPSSHSRIFYLLAPKKGVGRRPFPGNALGKAEPVATGGMSGSHSTWH